MNLIHYLGMDLRALEGRVQARRWTSAVTGLAALLIGAAGLLVAADNSATAIDEETALARYREVSPTPATAPSPTAPTEPEAAPTTTADPTAPPGAPTPAGTEPSFPAPSPASGPNPAPADPPPSDGQAAQTPPMLETGVYEYRTRGGEQLDVPNGNRTYPERTTITITAGGCGIVQRWDVAEERWDAMERCDDAEHSVQRLTSFHQFFNMSSEETLTCEPGSTVGPRDPQAGMTYQADCANEDTRSVGRGEVLGTEVLEVGDTPVETVRMRMTWEVSGANQGTRAADYWATRSGLLVRNIVTFEAQVSTPFGPRTYREQYRLELESLTPRR